jgi:chromosome segregation ATPase
MINNSMPPDQLLSSEDKHQKHMQQSRAKEEELTKEIETLKTTLEEKEKAIATAADSGDLKESLEKTTERCKELETENEALKADVDSLSVANMELVSKLASI